MSNQALTEAVYYILLSLIVPRHGYGIMQNVEELSNKRVKLAAGTLYGALNTLLEKRWIVLYDEDPVTKKKEYIITQLGKDALNGEVKRLNELINNASYVLEGKDYV